MDRNFKQKKDSYKKYHKLFSIIFNYKQYFYTKVFLFIFILFISYSNNFNLDNKEEKNNKIIVMIFAGRKKYLNLLMIYLNYLKKIKKIHEIHFWQFTNNLNEVQYLESISNIHKTSSQFTEYRNIFPEIKENKFLIGIKSTKGGAYLLLNDKYEIIFNIDNSHYSMLINKINNETIKKKGSKIPINKFFVYKIEIIKKILFVKEKNIILFKYKIEDDSFLSVKIHSIKDSEIYWDYKEIKNQNNKLFDSVYRKSKHWYEAYKYYLTYEYELLIKIDDDIIYIDINRFDEYIDFIRNHEINITIPNLVNHAVSLFYNSKYGLIPNNILKQKYINKNYSVDIYNYYRDGKQAEIIHKYFIKNINKFINNKIEPINLNGQKPSICMFGIKKENFINVYKTSIIEKYFRRKTFRFRFNDEVFTYNLKNNYLFPKFVCVHYQFGPQIRNGLNEQLISEYKKLIKFEY